MEVSVFTIKLKAIHLRHEALCELHFANLSSFLLGLFAHVCPSFQPAQTTGRSLDKLPFMPPSLLQPFTEMSPFLISAWVTLT